MSSINRIFSATVWTIVYNVINAVYNFVAVPLLISHYGKEEYGLIGLALSINVYVGLMDMGFNSTNVRFFSSYLAKNDNNKVNKLFGTSLCFYGIVGLVNSLILVLLSIEPELIFNIEGPQISIFRTLLLILAISAFFDWFSSCFDQLIKATENVAWIQKRCLLPKFIQIFVLVSVVLFDLPLVVYFALTSFSLISILPLSVGKIKKELKFISFFPKIDKESFKELLPYSLNVFSFTIFQVAFQNMGPILLGIEGTLQSVAGYRIMNGLIALITLLTGVFMNALLPTTSKIVAQNDKAAYYRVAYDGTKYSSIFISFCIFGMISIGDELLRLYVGDDFIYLKPWLFLWLVFLLSRHNQVISSLILAGTDLKAISYMSCISSVFGVIIMALLIPSFYEGGVVIAFSVYTMMQMLFYYLYYWPKRMGIDSKRVFLYSFGPTALIGAIISILLIQVSLFNNMWVSLVVKGLVFSTLFLIIHMFVLSSEDKNMIKNLLFNFKK